MAADWCLVWRLVHSSEFSGLDELLWRGRFVCFGPLVSGCVCY